MLKTFKEKLFQKWNHHLVEPIFGTPMEILYHPWWKTFIAWFFWTSMLILVGCTVTWIFTEIFHLITKSIETLKIGLIIRKIGMFIVFIGMFSFWLTSASRRHSARNHTLIKNSSYK